MNEILILLVLLVLSGFFSGSETALTAMPMARADALAREGRPGAEALLTLKSNSNRMLIALLIGNNLVNIGASAMATVLATEAFGALGPGLAVGALTLVILIFGEVTPKTFAARHSTAMSLLAAPLLLLFMRVSFPLVWLLEKFIVWMQSLSQAAGDPTVTESELISMAIHGAEEGTIEQQEQAMIQRIFDFNDLRARDIMIPRHQVFSLNGSLTIRDTLPDLLAQPFSRIPLHNGKPDEINRVVYLREILAEVAEGNLDKTLNATGHDPLFVPPNKPIDELFDTLRGKKQRLIIVVDEFGILQGLFTLEDMLEELVGEIYDDMDPLPPHQLREADDGGLLVDGATELKVLESHFGLDLSGKPTDSVNLWLLNHAERIPAPGERFVIDRLSVRVERASRRRVHQLRIHLAEAPDLPPPSPNHSPP